MDPMDSEIYLGVRFCALMLSGAATAVHTLPASKTRHTALRHLLAGVTCARDSLMPRLQAYARDEVAGRHERAGSESIGDPPSKIGFTSLPPELQGRILILAKQQGSDPGGSRDGYGAPQVCRAWDAHYFLHACTAVYTPTAGSMAHEAANLRALAMLPYSHALQTISCNDFHAPFVTAILGAMLTAPSLALLRLRTLSLRVARSSDMAIALAAAEAAPQLTALALRNQWHPANVGQHVVMLPRLPQLRSLDLGVPLPDDESPGVLAVDMSSLSTMRQLTFLSLDLNILGVAEPFLHSLTASMLQVGESLRTLTALRTLNLACWTCECVADSLPSWCALASALPNLAHLTDLRMLHLRMPDDPTDASHLETLAFALPALSSLRALKISSYGDYNLANAQDAVAAHREGSERLARAIGALTGLQSISLFHLPPYLIIHDCYLHFGSLAELRSLTLDDLGVSLSREAHVRDAVALVNMLSGMPCLQSLVMMCPELTPLAGLRLLVEALPTLSSLTRFCVLSSDLAPEPCLVLAAKIGDGCLPNLQVASMYVPEGLDELNELALRDVIVLQ